MVENASQLFNHVMTLVIMAIALGMDALSVGLGMGMLTLRYKQIFKIGLVIGVFHMIMPLIGIAIGELLSQHFGEMSQIAGGILLVLLGGQMIFSSFGRGDEPIIRPVGFGLFVFAFSVSLDSFSVGLSLGIYGAKIVLTIILFGLTSMVLTWVGLVIGRNFRHFVGHYSEAFGGLILLIFGVKLLLHV
ncbi:hypothetical protein GMB86_03035 [Terrilactibacillus sp. BCM23-1]|uniref:Putative manganese efflux pump MntP n=1 Tax=Terrilactibacillus tamarindi TaxID=2599694 RepID=A0A6N8CLY6_9BACI|nr:manganese efflux pump MntP family protein [Terrilactibacillus tamarindi]MTT30989.1 hypothetical protein [Terrilactibacillus tamarindi]